MHRIPPWIVTGAAFLAAAALAAGTAEAVGAQGPNDEISVFTNTNPEGPVASEIRRVYAHPVEVVGEEPSFRLEFIPFHRFGSYKLVKNQIFAVNLGGDDRLARELPEIMARVDEEKIEAGEPFRILVHDLWATGQTTLIAAGWSETDLYRLFAGADSVALRRQYETAVAENLTRTMFALGEDPDIPQQIAREFGWTLRLLPGFHAASDPGENVLKLNAFDPVRIILAHWTPVEVPLDELSWAGTLDHLLHTYNDGDYVLHSHTDVFLTRFQEEPALKWEGVWQNDKFVIGGPFRAYAFRRGGRSYLLVGIVFSPGNDKVYVLRQMEALFRTFRPVS